MAADPDKARGIADALGVTLSSRRKNSLGAMAWCKRCSRHHRRRMICDLYLRTRTLDNGKKVKRWAH